MKVLGWILGFVVLAVGIFFYRQISAIRNASTNDLAAAAAELPSSIARYRALGLPWQDSYFERASIPDEDNALTYLASGTRRLSLMTSTGDLRGLAKLSSASAQPVLKFCYAAATKEKLAYAWSWDNSLDSSSAYSNQAESSLLLMEAERAAERGDVDGAVKNLITAQKICSLMLKSKNSSGAWLCVRETNSLCHTYEKCLAAFFRNDAAFSRFTSSFQLQEIHGDLGEYVKSTFYPLIAFVRRQDAPPNVLRSAWMSQNNQGGYSMPSIPDTPDTPDGVPISLEQRAYLDRILTFAIDAYSAAAHAKGFTQAGAAMDEVSRKYEITKQNAFQMGDSYLAMNELGLGDGKSLANFDEVNSKVREERLLLGALRYRKAHGTWPPTVEAMGHEVDAIDLKPFSMLVFENQLAIYTLAGPDAKDTRFFLTSKKRTGDSWTGQTAIIYPPPLPKISVDPFPIDNILQSVPPPAIK